MVKIYCKDEELKPTRGSKYSAGIDLRIDQDLVIHETSSLNPAMEAGTGVHVEIPEGFVGLVFIRSSLGKRGLMLTNSVGVIDSDYRGEIKLVLRCNQERIDLKKGERIAQLVIVPYLLGSIDFVDSLEELSETDRGEGGFGSTGIK